MGLLTYLILLAISGLIVGGLARLALPGPDPMGIGTTILIGIAGSFLGGALSYALFGGGEDGAFHPAGWIASILGAVVLLFLYRMVVGRRRAV